MQSARDLLLTLTLSRLDLNKLKPYEVVPENGYEAEAIRRNRIADLFFLVLALILTLITVFSLVFIGVGIIKLIFVAVWAAALMQSIRKGRKKGFGLALFGNIFWAFIVSIMFLLPSPFSSQMAWRYGFQLKYVDMMNNGSFDCFPDKLPEEISDYKIEYLPSMMQGTGHFRIHFKTSAQQIEQYENEYSAQAIYTIPLADFNGQWHKELKEVSSQAETVFEGDNSLEVAYDESFWEGCEDHATVYVISAVHYWNHPHSGAVIINRAENMIEYTHLG